MRASEAGAMSCDQKDRFARSPRPAQSELSISCRCSSGEVVLPGNHSQQRQGEAGCTAPCCRAGAGGRAQPLGASRGHPTLPAPLGALPGPEVQPSVSHMSSGRWIQKLLQHCKLK